MATPAPHDLSLAESVSLVACYAAVTGERLRQNKTCAGRPERTEAAAMLMELADDESIVIENIEFPRIQNRRRTSTARVGLNEPRNPLLLPLWQALHKQSKPRLTESLLDSMPTGKLHERLTAAGLLTQGGAFITRDLLTPEGIRVRAELSEEINSYLDLGKEAAPLGLSERSALTLALILYCELHGPWIAGHSPEAALEVMRRLKLAVTDLVYSSERADYRGQILLTLTSVNARDNWI
ncbi:hypothetical protein ESZ53_10790 [Salinibacterium sp. UTAS2018]|uniref:hypothetical protein n=1 Tax=Salinibacterium sp. UTAS2018 TaxID=2508880 RepID=UPI0010094951|nr:hypothetical protein [Salinibacterium sp. UTAS2018]QAV70886.1 hypothetical protein ESZ53_10790 [Salinibacterium sp. UTAS2018]